MPAKSETEILTRPTDLEIFKCQKMLGTGKDYDIPHLFEEYANCLWVMEENNEWSVKKYDELTQAKFILLREKVLEQIRTNGRFEIISSFQNPCTKCGGAGEIFKFVRKSQTVNCMKCVEGKLPGGETCLTCRGKARLKTFGIIAELRDTTTCHFCKGRGFFKEKNLDNPVFDNQAAKELKARIVEKTTPANLGAEIHSASSEPDQVAANIIDISQDEPIGEGATQKIQQDPSD